MIIIKTSKEENFKKFNFDLIVIITYWELFFLHSRFYDTFNVKFRFRLVLRSDIIFVLRKQRQIIKSLSIEFRSTYRNKIKLKYGFNVLALRGSREVSRFFVSKDCGTLRNISRKTYAATWRKVH